MLEDRLSKPRRVAACKRRKLGAQLPKLHSLPPKSRNSLALLLEAARLALAARGAAAPPAAAARRAAGGSPLLGSGLLALHEAQDVAGNPGFKRKNTKSSFLGAAPRPAGDN